MKERERHPPDFSLPAPAMSTDLILWDSIPKAFIFNCDRFLYQYFFMFFVWLPPWKLIQCLFVVMVFPSLCFPIQVTIDYRTQRLNCIFTSVLDDQY